ncbi:MAG: hypothetical protein B7Z35_04690 [Hydrogenophilales bacterium 12-61-10]|nr:MAG: hypothetical protein B7Z35_04690 [Hydrogenophilales bacterium 12-61-10]
MTKTSKYIARACAQQGQSTVEFVVLGAVLVPLLLIVPLIGKHMDIAQATAVASRYVAFEGIARHSSSTDGWKSDADLAQEVRRRFFSNSDAPIKTHDMAGNFNAHRNPLWFDHRGTPLLSDFSNNVGVTTQKQTLAQPFGALASGFKLPQDNLYTGEVTVNIDDIANLVPFDTLGLKVSRHTSLLVDPWAASGSAQVDAKIKQASVLFPYQPLALIAAPLAVLMSNPLMAVLGTDSTPPEVGRVDPDRVPADRVLEAYQ